MTTTTTLTDAGYSALILHSTDVGIRLALSDPFGAVSAKLSSGAALRLAAVLRAATLHHSAELFECAAPGAGPDDTCMLTARGVAGPGGAWVTVLLTLSRSGGYHGTSFIATEELAASLLTALDRARLTARRAELHAQQAA